MAVAVRVVTPVVLALFARKETKELVIALLERYANSTDNAVDNLLVAKVRVALLKEI